MTGAGETVTVDAAEFAKLRAAAAVGIVEHARQLVAAAVAEGRIPEARAAFWTQHVVRHGRAAEVELSRVTPVPPTASVTAGQLEATWPGLP